MRNDKFGRFVNSMFYDIMVKALQFRSIVVNPELFGVFLYHCASYDPRVWDLQLSKDGLEVYNFIDQEQRESLMLKTRCTIYRSVREILHVVSSLEHKQRYDPFMSTCSLLKEFDPTFKVGGSALGVEHWPLPLRVCVAVRLSNGYCRCVRGVAFGLSTGFSRCVCGVDGWAQPLFARCCCQVEHWLQLLRVWC